MRKVLRDYTNYNSESGLKSLSDEEIKFLKNQD